MPRLFTGLEIPDDIGLDLDLMRGGVPGARWIDRDSYHVTLRFIGDIDEYLAREITYELEGIAARPFALQLSGCGVFGGKKPHTLFAGVAESADLRRLQSLHERICQVLGLPAQPQPLGDAHRGPVPRTPLRTPPSAKSPQPPSTAPPATKKKPNTPTPPISSAR